MYFVEHKGIFYKMQSDAEVKQMVLCNGSKCIRLYKLVRKSGPDIYAKLYGEYDGLGRYYTYSSEEVKIAGFNVI